MNNPPLPSSSAALRKDLLTLAGLLTLGVGLRYYGLDFQSLWNDELSAWARARHDTIAGVMEFGVKTDRHPPGYRLFMWSVMQFAGDSPIALRAPSAIAGALCIPLIFLLGRELLNRHAGLIAAALMTASWAPVYYSQEATVYSCLLLLVVLSAWLAARWWRTAHVGLFACWCAAALTTCYFHYYGCLLIGLQLTVLAVASMTQARLRVPVVVGFVLLSVGFGIWLPSLIHQLEISRSGGFPGIGVSFALDVFRYFGNQSIVSAGILALLAAAGLAFCRPGRERVGVGILLIWAVIPVLVLAGLSLWYRPLLAPRHLIIVLPAVYLLAGYGVSSLVDRVNLSPHIVAATTALVLSAWLIGGLNYFTTVTKQQFREAAKLVHELRSTHPEAYVIGYVWSPAYLNYYLDYLGSPHRIRQGSFGHERHLERVDQLIRERNLSDLIYVTAHRRPRKNFIAGLSERGELRQEHMLVGASVRHYAIAADPP